MATSDAILAEFTHEAANTRKILERVPEGRNDWQPHPKSMTLGRLAYHVAELPSLAAFVLGQDSWSIGGPRSGVSELPTRAELLARFDANVEAARKQIAATSDAEFMKPWSLVRAGQTLATLPKLAALRSVVMSHTIHHRAQLGVYLRLNDVPVPGLYGPSADEAF